MNSIKKMGKKIGKIFNGKSETLIHILLQKRKTITVH